MTHVVLEAAVGQRKYWAWGRVDEDGGFTDVLYTDTGGNPVDLDSDDPKLGRHLFTVPGAPLPADTPDVVLTMDLLINEDEENAWGIAFDAVQAAAPALLSDPTCRMSIHVGRPRGFWGLRSRVVSVTVTQEPPS